VTAKKTKPSKPDEVLHNCPVAHVDWNVEFWYKLRDIRANKKGRRKRLCGQCITGQRTIRIDNSMSGEAKMLAFWHEWVHAFAHTCGYDKMYTNESEVEAFAQCIARTIEWLKKEGQL
jgi:Zn-dependent peptidase ImmA (M78 family)